jgi:hypothetical protein
MRGAIPTLLQHVFMAWFLHRRNKLAYMRLYNRQKTGNGRLMLQNGVEGSHKLNSKRNVSLYLLSGCCNNHKK